MVLAGALVATAGTAAGVGPKVVVRPSGLAVPFRVLARVAIVGRVVVLPTPATVLAQAPVVDAPDAGTAATTVPALGLAVGVGMATAGRGDEAVLAAVGPAIPDTPEGQVGLPTVTVERPPVPTATPVLPTRPTATAPETTSASPTTLVVARALDEATPVPVPSLPDALGLAAGPVPGVLVVGRLAGASRVPLPVRRPTGPPVAATGLADRVGALASPGRPYST